MWEAACGIFLYLFNSVEGGGEGGTWNSTHSEPVISWDFEVRRIRFLFLGGGRKYFFFPTESWVGMNGGGDWLVNQLIL